MFDLLEEAWDFLVEGFFYLISFEWIGDVWEGISTAFEDIGELSYYGIAFGLLAVGVVYLFRGQMLEPFLRFYSPSGKLFWGALTYIGTGIGGYFMGKYFENS